MKISVTTFDELQRFRDAKDLVKLRLRVSIIGFLTGVPALHVRRMWQDEHGETTPRGQLPAHVGIFIKDPSIAANLAGFVAHSILKHGNLRDANTARNLIDCCNEYRAVSRSNIDITAAWYALRDVSSGLVEWRRCRTCSAHHMFALKSYQLRGCPFCRLTATVKKAA